MTEQRTIVSVLSEALDRAQHDKDYAWWYGGSSVWVGMAIAINKPLHVAFGIAALVVLMVLDWRGWKRIRAKYRVGGVE